MKLPVRFATAATAVGLLLCLQVVFLSGCAGRPAPLPEIPVAEAVGRALLDQWEQGARHQTLQGLAKVKVKTPQQSLSGSQVLAVHAPDRLRAETLSPFGTPLLVLAVNGSEFAVQTPMDNQFFLGLATPENLGRFTRLPMRLEDLVNILLFHPPRISRQHLETVQQADGGWLVMLSAGPRRQSLRFDAERRLVEVRYFQHDALQLRLGYGDFATGQPAVPRRIDLDLPQQQTEASLVFKELEIDHPLAEEIFVLNPPAGSKVTFLEDLPAAPAPAGPNAANPGSRLPTTQTGDK